MIDTHCHLTFPDYEGRIDQALADAAAAGVDGVITVSTTTADCLDALALAERHPEIHCTAGVHPLHSDRGPHRWENLRRVASSPRCVAWGELGLDNHYDKPTRDLQRDVLAEQLDFIQGCMRESDSFELPVVLHCRKAFSDLIPALRATEIRPERFVFHCFTGDERDMRMVLDFGAYVSFTGVVTYRNAPEVRAAAAMAPLDRIMVETDAPFLSPEPHRKVRPNEPQYVAATARFLADLRGLEWEDFHAAINANTKRFYGVEGAVSAGAGGPGGAGGA